MTSVAALARLLVPDFAQSQVAIAAPATGGGYWAGAPSALYTEGMFYLAYRLRRPVAKGRGYAVQVGRSDDGVRFHPILTLNRDDFDCASFERPALVRRPDAAGGST